MTANGQVYISEVIQISMLCMYKWAVH